MLICEEDQAVLELTTSVLTDAGYRVLSCGSGREEQESEQISLINSIFPNGEALYLLQLALTGSQRFLGFSPLVYVILCLFGLASLSREHGRLAFLLTLLTPVGLAQAMLNYVDWAFFFWFIAALAFPHSVDQFPHLDLAIKAGQLEAQLSMQEGRQG